MRVGYLLRVDGRRRTGRPVAWYFRRYNGLHRRELVGNGLLHVPGQILSSDLQEVVPPPRELKGKLEKEGVVLLLKGAVLGQDPSAQRLYASRGKPIRDALFGHACSTGVTYANGHVHLQGVYGELLGADELKMRPLSVVAEMEGRGVGVSVSHKIHRSELNDIVGAVGKYEGEGGPNSVIVQNGYFTVAVPYVQPFLPSVGVRELHKAEIYTCPSVPEGGCADHGPLGRPSLNYGRNLNALRRGGVHNGTT